MVPFGPKGPVGGQSGGGDCVDSVRVGGATVVAQEGCLERKGDRYTARGDVRVNGIDLVVGATKPTITIDKGERTLETSGKVEGKIGNVVLGRQRLSWRLPKSTGQITDLAGNPAKFDTGAFGTDFLGLDVSGWTVPELAGPESVRIPVNLGLPAPFDSLVGDSASASIVLRASNDTGLILTGLDIEVKNVWLGIARIEDFTLHYVGGSPQLLQGHTKILLPPAYSGFGVGADFGLRDGDFNYAKGELGFPSNQLLIATDVFLKYIRFGVQAAHACAQPTRIEAGVTLITGPEVAGTGLIRIDGDAGFSLPRSTCGTPGAFDITGAGYLAGLKVLTMSTRFTTDLQFAFKTALELDLEAAEARIAVEGGIDIPAGDFYAAGQAELNALGVHVFGIDTIVTNKGMAACTTNPAAPPTKLTFEYRWGRDPSFELGLDCGFDISEYKPAAFASAATASQGGEIVLPRGAPSATLRLDGTTGPPRFVLTGPRGLRIAHTGAAGEPTRGGRFAVAEIPQTRRSFVRIEHPAAGRYTLSPAPGSSVAAVAIARGLPKPSVRVGVRRARGGQRVLSYRIRPIDGQLVRFVEEGRGVHNILSATRKRRGRLTFEPAAGAGRNRTIYAIVEQNGLPRARSRVARFTAPSNPRPGRVRKLRLRRRGNRLLVSWRPARHAARYAVGWALRDGRHQARITRRRRLVIARVPSIDAGRITVAGLRRDNVAGPTATKQLKAKPNRRRHKTKPGHGTRRREER